MPRSIPVHHSTVLPARARQGFAVLLAILIGAMALAATARADSEAVQITEWMYSGSDGEFVELTNTGVEPVDLTGWSYDDVSATPGEFDLSGFGEIGAGESVVFTEGDPATFRQDWGLCAAAKVIGPYSNNLGRGDQINIFDAGDQLIDSLTYGDEDFPGSIRTQDASGWVSEAGLGADDVSEWTLSTLGDGEHSWTSLGGDIASPGVSSHGGIDPCVGEIRITEWMYSGAGAEFVELTNTGGKPIDMAGWSYDDSGASPGGFDLSGFGQVGPGDSVVFTEDDPANFRADWELCPAVPVIGPYTNNLGRGDQINIFDADDQLVDRLTYGDEDFPGSIRTQEASGWVSVAGLGADDVFEWTLSTVGDAEDSWDSLNGDTGSPGISSHGGAEHCAGSGENDPAIELDPAMVAGSLGDPDNPGATLTLDDPDTAVEDLTVEVSVGDSSVIEASAIVIEGDGAERSVSFDPAGRGVTTITFTVSDPQGNEDSANLSYGASGPAPDPSGIYHHSISDASAALDVGAGHMLLVNDETNTIYLHRRDQTGLPLKTWEFTTSQLGTGEEIDFESLARSGDLLVMSGSHGNNRSGEVRNERRTFVAATISGSGADTELAFRGRYNDLWAELRAWDEGDGHGLGADALGFIAGTQSGVEPDPPGGFNLEAMEFGPDGERLYLGFRAPTVEIEGTEHALIVPLTNLDDVTVGAPATGPAQFAAPILLDLDGRSIRALRSNQHGEYMISAGPTPANGTWALYTWDGDPGSAPAFNRELPPEDQLTGGVWESIVAVPHPLTEGATVRLVTDSGDTNFYGSGENKDLAVGLQKSYSQEFTLAEVPGGGEDPGDEEPGGEEPDGDKSGDEEPSGQEPDGDDPDTPDAGDRPTVAQLRAQARPRLVRIAPRRGNLAKLRFRVGNASAVRTGRIALCVRVPKRKLKLVGPRCVTRAGIDRGQIRQRPVGLRAMPGARGTVARVLLIARGPGVDNQVTAVRVRIGR